MVAELFPVGEFLLEELAARGLVTKIAGSPHSIGDNGK